MNVSIFPKQHQEQLKAIYESLPESIKNQLKSVHILPSNHKDVPLNLKKEIEKRSRNSLRQSIPSCCHVDDKNNVFIVLGDDPEKAFGHEIIHALQIKASSKSMKEIIDEMAKDGQKLIEIARKKCIDGMDPEKFRDLKWVKIALNNINNTDQSYKLKNKPEDRAFSVWEMHNMVHPFDETKKLGQEFNWDTHKTNAAVMAYYLQDKNINPKADVWREIMASFYEKEPEKIIKLVESKQNEIVR